MQELIVSCPNCSARYNVAKYESGTKFKCKSCGKFLIVPDKPDDTEEGPPLVEEEKGSRGGRGGGRGRGGRGGRGGKRGGTRTRAGARGRGRRDDDDDYDEDERQPLRTKKGPNWALIVGAGAALLLIVIVAAWAVTTKMAEEEALEAQRRADAKAQKDKYKEGGLESKNEETDDKGRKHLKYGGKKKDKYKPGDVVDASKGLIKELEDDKEEAGQETERTKWKDSTAQERHLRWRARKGLVIISNSSNASTANSALAKFKEIFGDPQGEREALEPLKSMGRDAVPAICNFMTKDVNHRSEEGIQMGTQIFNLLKDLVFEHFKYEVEFQYGPFESNEERWKAIVAVKLKCLENGYELEDKKKKK
ncbi:MAG: zinc ribbon domain-containing protein [Planctomycetota bacterium]|jgi:hypothetical protein